MPTLHVLTSAPIRGVMLALALMPLAAWAEFKVLDPQHRPAQELLPVLRPLVAEGGSVDAFDGRLVVRGTAAQIAQVEQLLATLDRPARQLLIQVRGDDDTRTQREAAGASGVYRVGSGQPSGAVRIGIDDSDSHTQRSSVQQVRAEEGREAQIDVGQSLPYASTYRSANGARSERIEYHDATSGFSVLPRLRGDIVELEIRQRQQLPGPGGVIQVQHLSSTVSGRLGEWFDIGGAVQQVTQSSRALLGASSSATTQARNIWVRVEPAN